MKVSRYWAKEEATTQDLYGNDFEIACWRSSNQSQKEAAAEARKAAIRAAERFRNGELSSKYLYSDQPLREEILQEWSDGEADPYCVVSRNRYGAEVLNTDTVMFVDIDLPEKQSLSGLKRLFGFGKAESTIPDLILKWSEENPKEGFRVYKTFAGFRLLMTGKLFDPVSAEARQILRDLQADPLYAKLCRVQQCFRARLTPKPWRIGLDKPVRQFPRTKEQEDRFQHWLETYQKSSQGYSTCHFLGQFGRRSGDRKIDQVIRLHDKACAISEKRPLA